MIARLWTASAARRNAAAYREHFTRDVLTALRGLDGFAGATLCERTTADGVEIVVMTRWRSWEAIRGFAGADVERAVVAPQAAGLLTRWDERVRHYEVVVEERA